jgi:hypothetical protein
MEDADDLDDDVWEPPLPASAPHCYVNHPIWWFYILWHHSSQQKRFPQDQGKRHDKDSGEGDHTLEQE